MKEPEKEKKKARGADYLADVASDAFNRSLNYRNLWSADEQLVTMRFCLRAFEPTRLIIGGDWPVSTLTAPLGDNLACTMRLLEDEDEAVRIRVLRSNAEEVYNL